VTRVLVLSAEPTGERMAGPAIRAFELARALAARCEVTLAAPGPDSRAPEGVVRLRAGLGDYGALLQAARTHDVLVVQELPAQLVRHVRATPARLVADLYNPRPMEVLEAVRDLPPARRRRAQRIVTLSSLALLASADLIVCASEVQRDLWLGAMAAADLLDLEAYRADPSLRSLIEVVPFGLPDAPPPPGGPAAAPRRRLLWAGGVWNWLDPGTVMAAVDRLADLDVELVFMGIGRPTSEPLDAMSGTEEVLARAAAHPRITVNRGWVPYEERAGWLTSATLGVCAHHEHLEARFSFRTRLLDHFWAGTPVVTSRGDALGELVSREGLGAAVAPGDAAGFAAACRGLLEDPGALRAARDRVAARAPGLRWSAAAAPLVAWCDDAPHRPRRRVDPLRLAALTARQYPHLAPEVVARQGAAEVARKTGRLVRRAVLRR